MGTPLTIHEVTTHEEELAYDAENVEMNTVC
jgi:hypothetical protein